ncbi:MAG: hypothetical protein C0615_04825 [Desulfuromonas sp.]|nr:MAG: hypothetical protein C0615_04825 [Desulfuromonas sp.]
MFFRKHKRVFREGSYLPIFFFLFFVVTVLNLNTFDNAWTFDDLGLVVNNPDVLSLKNFFKNSYPGRPIRELSYMLDYKLFGFKPTWFHIQQVLWHALNGCLLYLLFVRIGLTKWASLAGVLLFLVHPIQVESVASIGHRKELLPLFFALVSLVLYLKAALLNGVKQWGLYVLCVLTMVVAYLSNPTVGPFPILILLFDKFFQVESEQALGRYEKVVFLGGVAFALFGFLLVFNPQDFQQNLGIIYSQNIASSSPSYLGLILGCLSAIAHNAWHIIWPTQLSLLYAIPFYDTPWHASVLTGVAIVFVFLIAMVLCWQRNRKISFALAWIVLMYLPISNFYPLAYLLSDRYLYLVMPGVALLVASMLDCYSLDTHAGKAVLVFTVIILTACFFLAFEQNDVWQNDVTLYIQATRVNPESADAQHMLGYSFLEAGKPSLAKVHLKEAIRLNPFLVSVYKSLADAERQLGNIAAAQEYFRKHVRYSQLKGGL